VSRFQQKRSLCDAGNMQINIHSPGPPSHCRGGALAAQSLNAGERINNLRQCVSARWQKVVLASQANYLTEYVAVAAGGLHTKKAAAALCPDNTQQMTIWMASRIRLFKCWPNESERTRGRGCCVSCIPKERDLCLWPSEKKRVRSDAGNCEADRTQPDNRRRIGPINHVSPARHCRRIRLAPMSDETEKPFVCCELQSPILRITALAGWAHGARADTRIKWWLLNARWESLGFAFWDERAYFAQMVRISE